MSWIDRWETGDPPWDAGGPVPGLVDLVRSGDVPSGRALVPGCGAGWDVLALASEDRLAVGLDLAPGAARRFEQLRDAAGVPASRARVVVDDFFTWQPDAPFDFIWDYTFLCALPPERRTDWADRVHALLSPSGLLATMIFPIDPSADPDQGPPYPLSPELLTSLLGDRFTQVRLTAPERSHPGREGKERLALWRPR